MSVFALQSLISFITTLFLGNYVYFRNPKSPLNRVYLWLCLSSAYWTFAEFEYLTAETYESAYLWMKVGAFWPLSVSFSLHFVLVFTEQSGLLRNRFTYSLVYGPALAFSLIELTGLLPIELAKETWGWTYRTAQNSLASNLGAAWLLVALVILVCSCLRYYLQTTGRLKKQQAKYVLMGFAIPAVGVIFTEVLSPVLGIKAPPLTTTAFILANLSIGYGVWRYELFALTPITAAEGIASTMSDLLLLVSPDNKIRMANQAVLTLLRYEGSELIDQPVESIFDETFREELEGRGSVSDVEVLFKSSDGTNIPVSLSASLVRDKGGRPQGVVYVGRDITERVRSEEERARAETALRKSEERYRVLFNSGNDMMFVSGMAGDGLPGKTIEVNDVACQTLGYTREELLQLSFVEMSASEDANDFLALVEKFLAEKRILFDTVVAAKDGDKIPVEVNAHLFDLGGQPAILSIARDVTERVRSKEERAQAEKALLASEKRFRSIAETASDAIIILDSQENIFFWNQAAKDIFGYWTGETRGKLLDSIMSKQFLKVFRTVVSQVVSGEGSGLVGKTLETCGIRKDGSEFPIELSVAAWNTEEETFFTVIVRDTTERVRSEEERAQTEEAVRKSEQRFRDLAVTAGDWIWEIDIEGRYTYASPVVEQVLGYTPEEVLGRYYYDFFHPDDREPFKSLVERFYREKEPSVEFVCANVHRDGHTVVLETSGLLLSDAEGNPLGYRGAHRDVTAERQLAENLAAIHALGRELVLSRDMQQVAQTTVEAARLLFHCQLCGLWLIDEEERVLVRQANKSVEPVAHIPRLPLTEGRGITVAVALSGEPFYAPDVREEALYVDAGLGILSELCVPLKVGGRVIGVLNAESTRLDAFTEDDRQLFYTLADRAALAVENARLYEAVTQQREQLRALAMRLSEAEEAERQRLARELHDQVGQNLTALGINLNILRGQIPGEVMGLLQSRLDDSLELVEQTTERIRGVMADLRPPVLDDYGLVAALRWYSAQFAARVGIAVPVRGDELAPRLPAPVENALFRIAQEALTNVTRHAQATQATVTVEADDESVRLVVADDGIGFDPKHVTGADGRQGWGLLTMAERAEAVGSRFRIESGSGQGTRIVVEVER